MLEYFCKKRKFFWISILFFSSIELSKKKLKNKPKPPKIKKMREEIYVRWHSRAGQGAVTASGFLAQALGEIGFLAQSFPDFGAEKRGAAVVCFNRGSKKETVLDDPAHLTRVDTVVLCDPTLLGPELSADELLKHLGPSGDLLINTSAKTRLPQIPDFGGKVWHCPAGQIARETVGRNVPNVALTGALTHILGLHLAEIKKILAAHLATFFPEKLVEKNLIGFDRGAAECKEILPKKEKKLAPQKDFNATQKSKNSLQVVSSNAGWKSLPTGGGTVPSAGNSQKYLTGRWESRRLVFHEKNCINCGLCWPVCPDDSIVFDEQGNMIGVDLDHCKDCGLCTEICPANKNPDPEKHALVFEDET